MSLTRHNKKNWFLLSIILAFFIVVFLIGCGYTIKYNLRDKDIFISQTRQKLNVVVTTFSDFRPPEEHEKSERTKLQYKDLGDYTYDKGFKGKVNEEITKMVVQHLDYSKIFSKVMYAFARELTEDYVDSLRSAGFDAILTGDILDFYGYYDINANAVVLPLTFGLPPLVYGIFSEIKKRKEEIERMKENIYYEPGRNDLYFLLLDGLSIAGWLLGSYIESLQERNIEWHTRLFVQLINTSTYEVLWENTLESYSKEYKSMPGTDAGNGKFKVAVKSLREVVDQMVKSLSESHIINE